MPLKGYYENHFKLVRWDDQGNQIQAPLKSVLVCERCGALVCTTYTHDIMHEKEKQTPPTREATNKNIFDEMVETLDRIDIQIRAVEEEAQRRGVIPTEMQTPDGNWILIPLLAARAQLLASMYRL